MYSCSLESISHTSRRTALTLCKAANGLSRDVTLDQVIEVIEFQWSGHVYDLQTEDGIIVTNTQPSDKGICISNCGSFMRRHSDELENKPAVLLLHTDGTVSRHVLDTSRDKIRNIKKEILEWEEPLQVELSEFAHELELAHAEALSYAKTVIKWVQGHDVPDEVKEVILKLIRRK